MMPQVCPISEDSHPMKYHQLKTLKDQGIVKA